MSSRHTSSDNDEPFYEFTLITTPPKSTAAENTSNSTNTSPQNKSSGNRRKSGHHRIIQDDDITFESVIIEEDDDEQHESDLADECSTAITSSSSPPTQDHTSSNDNPEPATATKKRKVEARLPNIEEFLTEGCGKDDSANPNLMLAKKVAFLRVSVNYLMLNLGRSPFDFSQSRTLAELIGEYNMKNRIAGQGKE